MKGKIETEQSGFKSGLINQLAAKVATGDTAVFMPTGGLLAIVVDVGVGAGVGLLIQKGYEKATKKKMPGVHLIAKAKAKSAAKKALKEKEASQSNAN